MTLPRFVPSADFGTLSESLSITLSDIYQTQAYVDMDASLLEGEGVYYLDQLADIVFLIPLVKRRIPESLSKKETYDMTSPYGYPGYYSNRLISLQELETLLHRFKDHCAQSDIISVFLRLHPFHNNVTIGSSHFYQQIVHGETVYVDRNDYTLSTTM